MIVEYFRCWADKTWDTAFLEIPEDTIDDEIQFVLQDKVDLMSWQNNEPPQFVGVYNYNTNQS